MTTLPQVRAGCYLRISSDPNDKREGVERQREDTTILCETKGWAPVQFYEDNDRSASNGKDRPEWDRLLADIKADKIDAIAAWDQDRGWRVMDELVSVRKFFDSVGRNILFATTGQGDIDLYSPTGVMMAQIKTAVSEHEIAMMRVRQLRAARQRAEQGRPKWKRAFGYLPDTRDKRDDDGTRTPDPETQPLVKRAYDEIIAGASLGDIARMFNEAGAVGLKGQPWTHSTVSLFLRKPRNCGLREHNDVIVLDVKGEPVKGTWEPLVSEETWRAAQSVLNAPHRAPGRKSVRQHKLTGVLLCGKCGSTLSGAQQFSSGQIVYSCKKCRGLSVRARDVEVQLYAALGDRLAREDAKDLLRRDGAHDDAEIQEQLAALSIKKNVDLPVALAAEKLTIEQVHATTKIYEAQIEELTRRQQDATRTRVLKDIPLATPKARTVVRQLSADRIRSIIVMLGRPTVLPCGRGGGYIWDEKLQKKVPDPNRLYVDWP